MFQERASERNQDLSEEGKNKKITIWSRAV